MVLPMQTLTSEQNCSNHIPLVLQLPIPCLPSTTSSDGTREEMLEGGGATATKFPTLTEIKVLGPFAIDVCDIQSDKFEKRAKMLMKTPEKELKNVFVMKLNAQS